MASSERDRPAKNIPKFFSRYFILETDQAVFEDDEYMNIVANDSSVFLFVLSGPQTRTGNKRESIHHFRPNSTLLLKALLNEAN